MKTYQLLQNSEKDMTKDAVVEEYILQQKEKHINSDILSRQRK